LLFLLTFVSTLVVGGATYSLSILAILLAHELGHFTMCRRYGVPATWPYFLPFPNIFGTLGAMIMMRGRIPNRRVLFDIGIAGPLSGLAVAVPVTMLGLQASRLVPLEEVAPNVLKLGDSLLFSLLTEIAVGPIPEGYELVLGPMAFAGWAGLFVTALNLLPIGQLDGGHVVFGMLGERSGLIYKAAFAGVILVTVLTRFPSWLIIGALAYFLSRRHPLPTDPHTELDPARKAIGMGALLLFVMAFIPAPVHF